MISVILYIKESAVCGFSLSGHSTENASDTEGRIICSAVSSAAILTANTVTEIVGDKAEVSTHDGYLKLIAANAAAAKIPLSGFALHIRELQAQYPDKINLSEVSL